MTSDPGWMILVFVMSVSIPPSHFDSDQSSTGISNNIKINFPHSHINNICMYDVLYSNTIQKCPLILYRIYQLQHSVSLHLTASFMKHRFRVRRTSIKSLNVLMNSSSHAFLMYTNRQSSSRKSRHQKNRNRNIQVNTIVDIMIVHTLGFLFPWGGARGHDRLYKGLWTLRWALRLTSTLLGNMITVYPRPEEVSSINDKS